MLLAQDERIRLMAERLRFNGHPPLGVNATYEELIRLGRYWRSVKFQRAPTLGGECYRCLMVTFQLKRHKLSFNGHPPLGVNATQQKIFRKSDQHDSSFNGHPPLGVNATASCGASSVGFLGFQRAPTLGGECYITYIVDLRPQVYANGFNGHPPLGVNATLFFPTNPSQGVVSVSTGTHPWG